MHSKPIRPVLGEQHKVKQGQKTLFEGSTKQCWDFLMEQYGDNTVRMLINFGIHIE